MMSQEKRLVHNSALCLLCDDIIVSKHRHDFVACHCGSIGVDGGNEYERRMGESFNMINLSIYSDKFEDFREYLRWGRNYNKNMVKLPQTEWILIKDLETEHIKSILSGGYSFGNPFYTKLFHQELEYRIKK